jgi:hypothetical protein
VARQRSGGGGAAGPSSFAPVAHEESFGQARGQRSSWGGSASSRQRRWFDVGVLRGGDDGVVAGSDPGEVLRLEEEERERLGIGQIGQKIEGSGAHHVRAAAATTALIPVCPVVNFHDGAVKRHRGATGTTMGARFQWISRERRRAGRGKTWRCFVAGAAW